MVPEIQSGFSAQITVGQEAPSRNSLKSSQAEQALREVAARDVFEPSSTVGNGQTVQPTRKADASGEEGRALPQLQAERAYGQQARLTDLTDAPTGTVSNSAGDRTEGTVNEASEQRAGSEEDAAEERNSSISQVVGRNGEPLEAVELQQLRALQRSDSTVRAHERAHLAAAGGHARGKANFEYVQGPDGKRYAVGGEVQIDTSAEANPEATMRKMQVIRSAALAPANPSPQDRRVAAQAANSIVEAQMEMQALAREEQAAEKTEQSSQRQVESATPLTGGGAAEDNPVAGAEEDANAQTSEPLEFAAFTEDKKQAVTLPPFEFIAYTATEVSPPASPIFEFVARSTSETGAIPVERYQGVNVVV